MTMFEAFGRRYGQNWIRFDTAVCQATNALKPQRMVFPAAGPLAFRPLSVSIYRPARPPVPSYPYISLTIPLLRSTAT
jgi:hypothetical protein